MTENLHPARAEEPKVVPRGYRIEGMPVLPPKAAFLEMLVLIALPAALDYFWPAFPSLAELHPHPFWLPVLLLSLQYGTISGLVAAGLAISLSAVLGWPDHEVGENHFSYLLRIWAQPVLWLAAALLLGQFRLRQIEQKQTLALQVSELMEERAALAEHSVGLRRRCDVLEREIARRRDPSIRAFLGALGQIGSEPARAETLLAQCLELAFGRCQVGIYVADGGGARLASRHGNGQSIKPLLDRLAASAPLVIATMRDWRAVSVMVPGEEAVLAGEGLAAVPIISSAKDRVLGLLKLEAVDAAELDQDTIFRLSALAAHLAPLLEQDDRQWRAAPLTARLTAVSSPVAPGERPRLWRHVKWRAGGVAPGNGRQKPPSYG